MKYLGIGALGLGLAGIMTPAAVLAQDVSDGELQSLVDASATKEGAISTARRQADAGDITGAAATLERALLADPNANDARIWYASLLCRLDDPQGARIEVKKLDKQTFDDGAWSALTAACGAMQRPAAPANGDGAGWRGELGFGLAYESDTLGAIAVQLDTVAFPKKTQDGLAYVANLRLNGKSAGYFDKGGLYGGLSVAARRDFSGPRNRYETVDARFGFGRQSEGTDYAIGGVVRQAGIFGNHYLMEYGGQASVGVAHTDSSRIVLRGEAVYQDYANVGPGKNGQGWRWDAGASFEKSLGQGSSLAVGASIEAKDGKVRDYGYWGGRAFVAWQKKMENSHYVNLTAVARYLDFKNNPPAQDRKDTRFYARTAYGVPVDLERQLFIEGAVSYTARGISSRKTSTKTVLTPIADYSSFGAELRLVWKFGK